jgi:GNAT superfamily N-acetyltransferase
MTIIVRTATLDDTGAITGIHTSNTARWQRLTEHGSVEDVPYEQLSVHERWLHGGPWMSIETCAVHISHLRRGAGVPLVAEIDGVVAGYAEVFPGQEGKPFGKHLHVSVLLVHGDHGGQGVEKALLKHCVSLARELALERVCITNAQVRDHYDGDNWRDLVSGRRVMWPARTGQVFYQTTPHPNADPDQIKGWSMPLGRQQCAREEWVTRWPDLWAAIPALHERRVERFKFNVAGSNFFVMYTESRYDPRWASVHVWAGVPFTGPMLTAINDKAHKLGFRRLDSFVLGESLAFLGPDADTEGYHQVVYSIDL